MTTKAAADISSNKERAQQLVGSFRERVNSGRLGKNLGLTISLQNIDFYLHGVQRARYYLIGADSGVGKTSLANFIFLLGVWRSSLVSGKAVRIQYYSFEIAAEEQIANWCSYFISINYDIELPTDYIMGYVQGNLVSAEHAAMIDEASVIVEQMLEFVTIKDTPMHPTAIFHEVIDLAETLGTVIREEKINKRVLDKDGKPTKDKYITGFIPDDPEMTVLVMLDHAALATPEAGLSPKATIDRLSSYFVFIRNKFRFSICLIQQFNTEMQTVERRKFSQAAFAPQRSDFGDSKYTFRDADVVLGIIKPASFDLKSYYGYPVFSDGNQMYGLEDNFVAVFLMKNRYGPSNKMMPLFMNGITKQFYDLPLDTDDIGIEFFAEETTRLKQVCQLYSQPKSPSQVG